MGFGIPVELRRLADAAGLEATFGAKKLRHWVSVDGALL